jgi:hypothetical protein
MCQLRHLILTLLVLIFSRILIFSNTSISQMTLNSTEFNMQSHKIKHITHKWVTTKQFFSPMDFQVIWDTGLTLNIYIRLKIKPNSVRIGFLSWQFIFSTLNGIPTHNFEPLQHHSLVWVVHQMNNHTHHHHLSLSFSNSFLHSLFFFNLHILMLEIFICMHALSK